MNIKLRWVVLILFILIIGVPAFSQSANGESGVITSISISGLKRTKLHVAENPLRRFVGQEAASLDTDQVRAVVLDTGILEPLLVEIRDAAAETAGEKILFIEVREKWAIFPVPVFFIGSGSMLAGAAFYDANAFGLNQKMAVAGMYQTGGWIATALYMVPPDSAGSFGWIANVLYIESERRDGNQKNETLRRFNTRSVSAGGILQYRFTETLTGAFRLSYMNVQLRDTAAPLLAPPEGAQVISMAPEFSARRSSWDGYLLSEESASIGYTFVQGFPSPSVHSLSLRGVYEKSILPGFRTNFRFGLLYKNEAPLLFESGPHEAAVNILPSSFSARHYAGLSLGLEKYLFRFSFGTVSALGSWQMAWSNGPLLGDSFDYGVMGSLFFYMSRLAIPAMGFGLAYNIPAEYFQFSFSIGMSL
ncbi:hypothetical protein AGMMS50293_00760 [Spirochaetia bacterium]|nr:hypothetical protein AGMMS50293_00760 [Spirochaetia bacterium]